MIPLSSWYRRFSFLFPCFFVFWLLFEGLATLVLTMSKYKFEFLIFRTQYLSVYYLTESSRIELSSNSLNQDIKYSNYTPKFLFLNHFANSLGKKFILFRVNIWISHSEDNIKMVVDWILTLIFTKVVSKFKLKWMAN